MGDEDCYLLHRMQSGSMHIFNHIPRPNTMFTVLGMRLVHSLRQPLNFVESRGVLNPGASLQSRKEALVNIAFPHYGLAVARDSVKS